MWKFTSFFLSYLVTILTLGQTLLAINSFDCSNIEIDGIKFDLSSLNKTNIHNNTIEPTPPTFTKYTYHINPCSPLSYDQKLEYKCEDGTYICQIVFNYMKEDGDGERVTHIRPIAGAELNATITLEPSLNKNERDLSVILHGGTYNNEPQQANITFICVKDQDEEDGITIAEYKENTLFMKWKTHAACGEKPYEEDKKMGGFTKFIIILIIIGLCYFGLGAAYNYHVYKAHGWDLLPHLDFWRDFPYLISDVFKYLVNSVRTGSRGGYSRM